MSSQLLTSPDADRAEAAYRKQYALLYFIASARFRVPAAEAENLVHDVFVQFLRNRHRISDDRSWLIAAVCNASRDYWRAPERREGAGVPEGAVSPAEMLGAQLDVAALMRSLPERCRGVLRRRFCDGCSAEELAAVYDTSPGYAKLMLHRCLVAARALLIGARRLS